MNTINFSFPIPEPLKPYFKKEFLYLLESYTAHHKLFHCPGCKELERAIDTIGWSLDRHLTWFMSHFSVEPEDYEFFYIDSIITRPNWQEMYDDKWEAWLDKLVAPSDTDVEDVLGPDSVDEDEDE